MTELVELTLVRIVKEPDQNSFSQRLSEEDMDKSPMTVNARHVVSIAPILLRKGRPVIPFAATSLVTLCGELFVSEDYATVKERITAALFGTVLDRE